jgi:hypothetical protein
VSGAKSDKTKGKKKFKTFKQGKRGEKSVGKQKCIKTCSNEFKDKTSLLNDIQAKFVQDRF